MRRKTYIMEGREGWDRAGGGGGGVTGSELRKGREGAGGAREGA